MATQRVLSHLATKVAKGDTKVALSAFRKASVHLVDFDEVGSSTARSEISSGVNLMSRKTRKENVLLCVLKYCMVDKI